MGSHGGHEGSPSMSWRSTTSSTRDAAPTLDRKQFFFTKSEAKILRNREIALECAVDLDVVPGKAMRQKSQRRKKASQPPKAWCSAVGPRNHSKQHSTHIDTTTCLDARRHIFRRLRVLRFHTFSTSPRCWKLPSPATRPRPKHVKACQSIQIPCFTSVSIDYLGFPATSMCRFPSARSWLPT